MLSKAHLSSHLTILGLSTVLLVGCGSNDKLVSYKSGGMTHTFSEGKDSIPKDFPLPVYPKSVTTGSVSASSDKNSEDAKFLMLSSDDPYDQVGKYYQQSLKAGGWRIDSVQSLPKLINITARKEELDGNVMLSCDGNKTTISLAVSKNSATAAPADTTSNYTPDKLTPPTD